MTTELGIYDLHGNGDVSVNPARKAAAFPALLAKAETRFVETLMFFGKVSEDEAKTVFAFYKKNRLVKRDSTPEFKVKHGAYFDYGVINKALEFAEAAKR